MPRRPALGDHPPKPRLALRVGVTGHRDQRIAVAPDAVRTTIKDLLGRLGTAMGTVAAAAPGQFDTAGPPRLKLLSSLAEGADRIVIEEGCALGLAFEAVLPFPRDDYRRDFSTQAAQAGFDTLLAQAGAVFELDGKTAPGRGAAHAYLQAGHVMLRHSDLLIAVWDGNPAAGPGGTADIVTEAVRTGIPVLWIESATGRLRIIGPLDPDDAAMGTPATFARTATAEAIARCVRLLTAPPSSAGSDEPDTGAAPTPKRRDTAARRLNRFLKERRHRLLFPWLLNQLLIKLLADRTKTIRPVLPAYDTAAAEDWDPYERALKDEALTSPGGVDTALKRRFTWADNLATYYAELYTSGFMVLYVLAALAVLCSVLSLVNWLGLKPVFIGAELIIIVIILAVATRGRLEAWHDRFLDYRHLAELLRHLRTLSLTGGGARDATALPLGFDFHAGPSWVTWYYRATVRELSLPDLAMTGDMPARLGRVVLRTDIAPQIAYHDKAHRRARRLYLSLEATGAVLFGLTLLAALAFAVQEYALGGNEMGAIWTALVAETPGSAGRLLPRETIAFLGATFPAFAAAARAIRAHAEYREGADRSDAMARQLRAIERRLARAIERQDFAAVTLTTGLAAQIMVDEVSVWRFVYRTKTLELPE